MNLDRFLDRLSGAELLQDKLHGFSRTRDDGISA